MQPPRFLRHTLILWLVVGAVLVPGAAWGLDVFLDIPAFGACGLSESIGFEGQIEVLGFEQAITHETKRGMPTAADLRSVRIVKAPDRCSPRLFLASLADEVVPGFEVNFVEIGDHPYTLVRIVATEFRVGSVVLARGETGPIQEVITLAPVGQLEVTVWHINPDGTPAGSVTTCWDFRRNRACTPAD
jgi:hypothetical protein